MYSKTVTTAFYAFVLGAVSVLGVPVGSGDVQTGGVYDVKLGDHNPPEAGLNSVGLLLLHLFFSLFGAFA